ncbi:MAG TPA: hypothetical protein VF212_17215 [Longimicrobiales bacterium]
MAKLRRLARGADAPFRAAVAGGEPTPLEAYGEELAEAEAVVVEPGTDRLRAVPVGAPAPSAFTAFLDGIQRSTVALYHGPVPIVYAYAAAVVRTRRARRMATLAGAGADGLRTRYQEEREGVFFPFRLVEPAAVAAAGVAAVALRDTSPPDGEPLPLFPPALYARAAQAVNRWRESLEGALADRWCREAEEGWLLVDGSLTLTKELAAAPRAVGVIKSHRTRFFDGDDARTLLALEVGERSSIFQPKTRSFTPVYSWYLRLRSPAGRDALWGLVRVEAAATAATLERADEISRWLLAETAPLSLPDKRWDRLLYPIRDCEEYLRTRAPNI